MVAAMELRALSTRRNGSLGVEPSRSPCVEVERELVWRLLMSGWRWKTVRRELLGTQRILDKGDSVPTA